LILGRTKPVAADAVQQIRLALEHSVCGPVLLTKCYGKFIADKNSQAQEPQWASTGVRNR
jgi:hypothetical protein